MFIVNVLVMAMVHFFAFGSDYGVLKRGGNHDGENERGRWLGSLISG